MYTKILSSVFVYPRHTSRLMASRITLQKRTHPTSNPCPSHPTLDLDSEDVRPLVRGSFHKLIMPEQLVILKPENDKVARAQNVRSSFNASRALAHRLIVGFRPTHTIRCSYRCALRDRQGAGTGRRAGGVALMTSTNEGGDYSLGMSR